MAWNWFESHWRDATDRYVVVLEPHFPSLPNVQTRDILNMFSNDVTSMSKDVTSNDLDVKMPSVGASAGAAAVAKAAALADMTNDVVESKKESMAEKALCHGFKAWANNKHIQVTFVFGGEEFGIEPELLQQLTLWKNVMFASIRTRTRKSDDKSDMFSLNLSSAVLYVMSIISGASHSL
jgi:hypothetical protein